jgi:DNA repair exonuclease SbcCD ATPase subunit
VRKVPTELREQIVFAEALVRSAKITIDAYAGRLEQLNEDREAIAAREAQLRKDFAAAPALLESGQTKLNALLEAKRSIGVASGRTADPAKKRAKLEAKVQRHAQIAAKLRKLQEEMSDV